MLPVESVDSTKFLLSPMPGQMVSLEVSVGDIVRVGSELAVMEAMKMQNVLKAQNEVVIKHILVKPGQKVDLEETLMEFRPTVISAWNTLTKFVEGKKKEEIGPLTTILKEALAHQAHLAIEIGIPKSKDDQMKKEFEAAAKVLSDLAGLPDANFSEQLSKAKESAIRADNEISILLQKLK